MRVFKYVPTNPPYGESFTQLLDWLRREFNAVFRGINAALDLDVMHKEPESPVKGMIRYASGAPGWNPGAGEGLYVYTGTPPTWVKLH